MIVEKKDVIDVLNQLIPKLQQLIEKLETSDKARTKDHEFLEALYKNFKKDIGIIDISLIGIDIFM